MKDFCSVDGLNMTSNETVQVDKQDIKDQERFVHLSAHFSMSGGTEENIKARLGKARTAYNKLGKIWKNGQFTNKTKIKIFKCNVISVLLYGCGTWQLTKRDKKKLDVFLHESLHQIHVLQIYWPMQITSKEIKTRTKIGSIS